MRSTYIWHQCIVITIAHVLVVVTATNLSPDTCVMECDELQLPNNTYSERGILETLPDGSILFRVLSRIMIPKCVLYKDPQSRCVCETVPSSFSSALLKTNVKSLSVRLTRGQWKNLLWGDYSGSSETPLLGAELKASWISISDTEARQYFHDLKNMLAGVLCTSFRVLNDAHIILHRDSANTVTIQGFLQRETVCTENLTPLQLLLPCGRSSGLASMINSKKFFKGISLIS